MCVGLFIQSILYIIEMVKIAIRKNIQSKERSNKNVELFWFSENPQLRELDYYNRPTANKQK